MYMCVSASLCFLYDFSLVLFLLFVFSYSDLLDLKEELEAESIG